MNQTKGSTPRHVALLVLVLFSLCSSTPAQEKIIYYEDPMFDYDPGEWVDPNEGFACRGGGVWPRYGTFNDVGIFYEIPYYGYPLRYATFKGLNDTIQVQISWINYTDEDYELKDRPPETWFVPRVFRLDDRMATGIPLRDSTDIGYRIRGWKSRREGPMLSTPDAIPKRSDGDWKMFMDVWNLPEGHYSLCIDTTEDVPGNFIGRQGGSNYRYQPAHDLADTINAYEAIFRRALADSNYNAAKLWVEQMLAVNPTSVPGWWLRAMYYSHVNDTVGVKKSYDKALNYLQTGADPAMPDSTKRVLFEVEQKYIEWVGQRLTWERSFYGP